MFFCRRCLISVDNEDLGSVRSYHTELEREVFEDLTDYDCPKCGEEMIEGEECSLCGAFVEQGEKIIGDNWQAFCPSCYYEREEADEMPSVISRLIRRARNYGDTLRIDERACEPA